MRACYLTITTTADGEKSTVSRNGEFEISGESARLRYYEDQAEVVLTLGNALANLERRGDYSLRFTLEEGRKHEGTLGIGNNVGTFFTETETLFWAERNGALLVTLRYDLHFGTERQKMKLSILAKVKKEEEEV